MNDEKESVIQKLPDRLYMQYVINDPKEIYYLNDEISGTLKVTSTYKEKVKIKYIDIWLKENWEEETKKGWQMQREVLDKYLLEEKLVFTPEEVKEFEFQVNISAPWVVKTGENVRDWRLSIGFYYKEKKDDMLGYPYEDAQYNLNIDLNNPIRPYEAKEPEPELKECPECGWVLSTDAVKCPMCKWEKEDESKKEAELIKAQEQEIKIQEKKSKTSQVDDILREIPLVEQQISDIDQKFWSKLISQEEYMEVKTSLYEKLGALQGELEKLQSS